jgi:predicted nucleic acid-binding protein
MNVFLLDACAVIAYFKEEPGEDLVVDCLKRAADGQIELYIHAATVYEVYYQYLRDVSYGRAQEVWQELTQLPVSILYTFDELFLKQAADFKSRYRMSVADSFLLAQARVLDASVITSDHHELDAVEQGGLCRFTWMR